MENKEVSKIIMWAMIAVALFFDGTQALVVYIYFIPFVGLVLGPLIAGGVSFFAFMTFSLWFRLAGMKFNSKIVSTTVGTFFIELIPLLNSLPAWTLSVVIIFMYFQAKKTLKKNFPEIDNLALDKSSENNKNQSQN